MRLIGLLLVGSLTAVVHAQDTPSDSTRSDSLRSVRMPTIVVTATRTEKSLEDVAVPISVISLEDMKRQGSLRLGDALVMVPGLMLADDHGTGLQIRGLDADYTLILLDGEPIIGRTAGTLDVNRLATHGLSRIEVIRGPSSSLYGSDALAGVVNLVTAYPQDGVHGTLGLRTGTHATSDVSGQIAVGRQKGGFQLRVNRYASNGYDLTPGIYGQTAPSFSVYESDLRANLTVSQRLKLRLGFRGALEGHDSAFADREEARYTNQGERFEWSVHPEALLHLSEQLQLTTTLYAASFGSRTQHFLQQGGIKTYDDSFDQVYLKASAQLDTRIGRAHLSSLGFGHIRERVGGGRYGDGTTPRTDQTFVFLQQQWLPSGRVQFTAGARYDQHSDYAARLTPKLSVSVRPTESIRFRASLGSGFKAPALRQLYLAYTNAAAGYSVLGSARMIEGLDQLEREGQLDQVFLDPRELESIGAEHSVAVNVGISASIGENVTLAADAFHNRVRDLIESRPIARKTNGQFVYGYFNLARMYTRGLELAMTALPWQSVQVSGSYQYLQAHNQAVVDALRSGEVYGRDPDGHEYSLGLEHYTGLFGRSPHAATVRVSFQPTRIGLSADLRARWRSKYGFRDYDGNQLANRADEFVAAYAIVDATVRQSIRSLGFVDMEVQAGIHNVFDHKSPASMPSLSGRTLFATLLFNF